MRETEHLAAAREIGAGDLYADLMSHELLAPMSNDELIWHTGALLQMSQQHSRREGVQRVIEWARPVDDGPLTPTQKMRHYYTLGNAWAELHDMLYKGGERQDPWDEPERQQALRCYRLAMAASQDAGNPDKPVYCQIVTNLANLYSSVGRIVAALRCWSEVLSLDPEFAMASGNRGVGLAEYARLARGDACQCVVFLHAREDLRRAVAAGVEPHALPHFEATLDTVERALQGFAVADGFKWEEAGTLGDSVEEQEYRRWCLDNTLVLNPLNDLGPLPIASCDTLALPGIATPVGEMVPHFHALFNQLKQEYIHGRYCLYEGLTTRLPPFVDRGRHLTNTLDYHSLSMAVEKTRIAFRIGYSLLDKVSYFLSQYLALPLGERVYFRTVWYAKNKPTCGLRSAIRDMDNRPFRGLFWLSKDLLSTGWSPAEAIEPDAARLAELRNALEHTALHVHEPVPFDKTPRTTSMALHVERDDFERKALRLLQMSRAALIYLALGIGVEEKRRRAGKRIPPMHLYALEDDNCRPPVV